MPSHHVPLTPNFKVAPYVVVFCCCPRLRYTWTRKYDNLEIWGRGNTEALTRTILKFRTSVTATHATTTTASCINIEIGGAGAGKTPKKVHRCLRLSRAGGGRTCPTILCTAIAGGPWPGKFLHAWRPSSPTRPGLSFCTPFIS